MNIYCCEKNIFSMKGGENETLHKECKLSRNAESERNSLPQVRIHEFIIQYKMLSPETYTSIIA